MLLEDRVAIVAGIGPGLGRAIAVALAEEGAHVALGARTQSYLEEVAGEIQTLGRQALVVPTDITDADQCKNIADAAFSHFGRIDVLVNNAGWSGTMERFINIPVQEWREVLEGNLVGTMAMCKYAAPYMIRAGKGAIVNVTSISMRQGLARRSPYGSAKAAVTTMTQSLARELGRHNVRVNSIAPGPIWSDKLQDFYRRVGEQSGKTPEDIYKTYAKNMPLGKIPLPEEIASAVVFMASDWATPITGQSLDTDGGFYFH